MSKVVLYRKNKFQGSGTISFQSGVLAKLSDEYEKELAQSVEKKEISFCEFTQSLSRFTEFLMTFKDFKIVISIDEAHVILKSTKKNKKINYFRS